MIIQADARHIPLADNSVHCVITSPPYFGLRDYGVEGQIGLEQSPEQYVNRLVEVFRGVWRVLRADGTLWLNLGDSYNNADKWGGGGANTGKHSLDENRKVPSWSGVRRRRAGMDGVKSKDLIGIPWMVAFALRADGWYLRQDIIWHKPNAMPESVKDRCTRCHEYLFMLTKSPVYHYDHEVIMEPVVSKEPHRFVDGGKDKQRGHSRRHTGFNGRYAEKIMRDGPPTTRNRRSVWTVSTKRFPGAHFATFPPDLIEPCVAAGCPPGGIVFDPFAGAGTTWLVAAALGRQFVGTELNPDYIKMARSRVYGCEPVRKAATTQGQRSLFCEEVMR